MTQNIVNKILTVGGICLALYLAGTATKNIIYGGNTHNYSNQPAITNTQPGRTKDSKLETSQPAKVEGERR